MNEEIEALRATIRGYEEKNNREVNLLDSHVPLKIPTRSQILGQLDDTLNKMYLDSINDLQKKLKEADKEKEKNSSRFREREKAFKQQKEQLEAL